MPNAILRVGPFIKSGNFVDQPSDLSAPDGAMPINCANTTSSSRWPWRYNEGVTKSTVTHTGCESGGGGEDVPTTSTSSSATQEIKTATGNFTVSSSVSSNREVTMSTSCTFFYQAAQSFQIKVTFLGSASASSGSPTQTNTMLFVDSQSTSPVSSFPTVSGSVTRTLPAAVVPASYTATLETNGRIDFPANICIANSETVTANASLAFEFL